eukprot:10592847-Alexandrium_andersonii.AAC.1
MQQHQVYPDALEAVRDSLERQGIRSPVELARWIWHREEWQRSTRREARLGEGFAPRTFEVLLGNVSRQLRITWEMAVRSRGGARES